MNFPGLASSKKFQVVCTPKDGTSENFLLSFGSGDILIRQVREQVAKKIDASVKGLKVRLLLRVVVSRRLPHGRIRCLTHFIHLNDFFVR